MQNQPSFLGRVALFLKIVSVPFLAVKEIIHGIKSNTIPWAFCAGWMLISTGLLVFEIDKHLILQTRLKGLYPYYFYLYHIYAFGLSTLMFWLWAWGELYKKKVKLKTLTNAFINAGLQSRIGRLPNFISDFPLDSMTRKMRLTNAGFPLSSFREHGRFIESELGIFIDEIKENRELRTIDIVYSHHPMPNETLYSTDLTSHAYEFLVGQTRAQMITANLRDTPHLLIAGQTGGGKSTFLRQFIAHLCLTQKTCNFLLIDLKGGLEFSIFEQNRQCVVVPHVLAAVEELKKIDKFLDERMTFLKANKCKDIDSYFKKEKKEGKPINLDRQIVVVDEAAEMFLAGHHGKANEIQIARAVLGRIARQGRAVGIHLVVATQRPDVKSLDPQVKANLTGVICFQMMNDASSISVLGNGRATDLPKIPGRAIWKNGIEMLEVQTPLLTDDEAEKLIAPLEEVKYRKDTEVKVLTQPAAIPSTKLKEKYRTPNE